MAKTRVAIACQGGGSQTAFTAGALKALCETSIADEVDVVSISGTSGGKIDRGARNIDSLILEGERSARHFLAGRTARAALAPAG